MGRAQIVEVGFVRRVHGVAGEVQLELIATRQPEELNQTESVFIEIDGIPVPFFIENTRGIGPDRAIVKFDTIHSANQAAELVGWKVLVPSRKGERGESESNFYTLIGFQVIDLDGVPLGKVEAFEEYSTNAVLVIRGVQDNEILVPAADEVIKKVNTRTRTITVELPEGLLDIYS